MNDLPGLIDQLAARLEALERRVAALEHRPADPAVPVLPHLESTQADKTIAATRVFDSASTFSILGRCMLGIAAAYLLRAIAQSNLLPIPAAAAVAILYAIAWLVFAAHSHDGGWFSTTLYTGTSALILAPMLWELTFRFRILAAPGAAAVIAVYIAAATILAWQRSITPVFWGTNVAAVSVVLSLFLASRSTTPFIAVLLFMLALAAFAESRNRAPGLRNLAALAASAAIWAAVYVYISPTATRPDYPPLSPAALILPAFILFTVYLASVVHNTVVRHRRITFLEIIQILITFVLLAVALDAFGPTSAPTLFGVLCLVLAAAGYAVVYAFFDRPATQRNYRAFSTWSAALVLTGCLLSLPDVLQAPCFSLAALAATSLGARFSRLVLVFHGTIYLAVTAAVTGLAAYILRTLAGTFPAAPPWLIYVAFLAAIVCYLAMPHPNQPSWRQQGLQLVVAALALCASAALLVQAFMGLAALHIQPGPHHLAIFRTLVLCAAALTLAWAGPRFSRIELTRIAYAALVLLAVKLIAEDLRHGRLAYIAASIFLFALTLLAVPRIARHARRPPSTPSAAGG